jgi:hypothetical protein
LTDICEVTMEIRKFHQSEARMLAHVDRSTMDPDRPIPTSPTPNQSNIDPKRSHLNFNLAPNNRRLNSQIDYITRVTGRKPKKTAVLFFSTWVVLPEQYKEHDLDLPYCHEFFQKVYDTLLMFYGLIEDDIASAWVHMDETRPHMHFYATPIYRREGERPRNYFDLVCPVRKYWKLHPFVEDMMRANGYPDIHMMNGRIKDGNWAVRDLKRNGALEKMKALEEGLSKKQNELSALDNQANDKARLLAQFEEEQREKEEKLLALEQSIQKQQDQLDHLDQDVLIQRTKVYRAKQDKDKMDPESEILLAHKDEIKSLLLSRPDVLSLKERKELERSLGRKRNDIQNQLIKKGRSLV